MPDQPEAHQDPTLASKLQRASKHQKEASKARKLKAAAKRAEKAARNAKFKTETNIISAWDTPATNVASKSDLKQFLGVDLPEGYPDDENWNTTIAKLLQIAAFKAALKLAKSGSQGIESVQSGFMGHILSTCIDKQAILTGNPTNISAQLYAKTDHITLKEKLKKANTTVVTTSVVEASVEDAEMEPK